jgi:UDP-glucose 4-epimerase
METVMAGPTRRRGARKGTARRRKNQAPPRLRVALTGVNNPTMARLAWILDADPQVESLVLFDVIRPSQPFERARFYEIDLTLPESDRQMSEALRTERTTTLVHGAFLANPARDPIWAHELEAIGTLHVLDACAAAPVKHLLLKGTTMVYGAHHDNPAFMTEDAPMRADRSSRWIRDKMEADVQFQRYGDEHKDVTVTIGRFATVLAPSMTHYLARYLTRPVVPVIAGFDPVMQFLDIQASACAMTALVKQKVGGIFNVAPHDVLPLSSVLRIGRRIPVPIPHPFAYSSTRLLWRAHLMDVPGRFLHYFRYPWVADPSRIEEVLGFRTPRSTRDVVEAFYRGSDTPAGDCMEVKP